MREHNLTDTEHWGAEGRNSGGSFEVGALTCPKMEDRAVNRTKENASGRIHTSLKRLRAKAVFPRSLHACAEAC